MSSSTLTSKGQITVPAAYRKALGLKTGDRVWFTLRDGVLHIDKRNWVERTKGMLAGRIPPADDIQQRIREEKAAAEIYSAEQQMRKLNK